MYQTILDLVTKNNIANFNEFKIREIYIGKILSIIFHFTREETYQSK